MRTPQAFDGKVQTERHLRLPHKSVTARLLHLTGHPWSSKLHHLLQMIAAEVFEPRLKRTNLLRKCDLGFEAQVLWLYQDRLPGHYRHRRLCLLVFSASRLTNMPRLEKWNLD